MMKWFYRLFTLAILAVAMGLPFFIDNKEGKPMLSLPTTSDILPTKVSTESAPASVLSSETTVYKWQDQEGGWHYGDTPPPNALNVSTITVNANTNLIQSVPTEKDEPSIQASSELKSPQKALPYKDEDLLSLDRAMNILNETKDVASMMEARNETLNQIVGDSSKN